MGWSVMTTVPHIPDVQLQNIVITGATDGIGREFALQLGKAGFNIFLASRSPDKLNAVAAELGDIISFLHRCACRFICPFAETLGVQTKMQAIDFSRQDEEAWESLANALSPLHVGVLGETLPLLYYHLTDSWTPVNNVGKSHEMPTEFVDVPEQEMHDILQINIISTLKITRIVLPGLIERLVSLADYLYS